MIHWMGLTLNLKTKANILLMFLPLQLLHQQTLEEEDELVIGHLKMQPLW